MIKGKLYFTFASKSTLVLIYNLTMYRIMKTQEQIQKLDKFNRDWRKIEEKQPEIIDTILDSNIDIDAVLPVYTYEGEFVVIINNYDNELKFDYVDDYDGNYLVKLSHILPQIRKIKKGYARVDGDYDCDINVSIDDSYLDYNGIEEILCENVPNFESELFSGDIVCAYVRASHFEYAKVQMNIASNYWGNSLTERGELIKRIKDRLECLLEELEERSNLNETLKKYIF